MKCLKCGTVISSDHVFCEECQLDMERHPVKPGTPIVLPHRAERPVGKPSHKRIRKAEDQLHRLRIAVQWLVLLVAILITALVVVIFRLINGPDFFRLTAAVMRQLPL